MDFYFLRGKFAAYMELEPKTVETLTYRTYRAQNEGEYCTCVYHRKRELGILKIPLINLAQTTQALTSQSLSVALLQRPITPPPL